MEGKVPRIALLAATVLVAWSSIAVAQNLLAATTETPKAKPGNPNAVVDPAMPKKRTNDWNAPAAADCTG